MRYRTGTYYTDAQKALMWERWKQGWTLHQIAHLFNRAHTPVQGILSRTGGIRPPTRARCATALTLAEREEISRAHGRRSVDPLDRCPVRASAIDDQSRSIICARTRCCAGKAGPSTRSASGGCIASTLAEGSTQTRLVGQGFYQYCAISVFAECGDLSVAHGERVRPFACPALT